MDSLRAPLALLLLLPAATIGWGCATGTLVVDGAGSADDDAVADDDASDDDASDDDASDDDTSDDDASDDDASDDDASDDDASDDDVSDDDATPPDVYDGATLVILEPEPGYEGEAGDLEVRGEVRGQDGESLPFDEIGWALLPDEDIVAEGAHTVLDLDPGEYTIGAVAELPNGDVLTAAVEGIRLRSPYAGEWAGSVEGTLAGSGYELPCGGEAWAVVDELGSVVEGEGTCVFEGDWLAIPLQIAGEIDDADVLGTATAVIDLGWFGSQTFEMEMVGGFEGDDLLGLEYGYTSEWLAVEGVIRLER